MNAIPLTPLDADGRSSTQQPAATPDAKVEVAPQTVVVVEPTAAGAPIREVETIARLAAMKPIDYDRVRKEEAKILGIQVKTLDELVKTARSDGTESDRLPFTDIEPDDKAVVPAELFDEVARIIRRFIVLEPEQADAAALWVVHTHMTEVADTSPIAIINAPEKACAKTLFQTILGRMAYRPLQASNATLSALFRAVELWRPTIFIDEADTFFRDSPEIHGMVNAGYTRGGFVLRSEPVGDSFEPRKFSVYCAKSIAGIALERHLPESTISRGIVFNLRRKLPHEKVERLRYADPAMFDTVASMLARFAMDYSQQVRLARPSLPRELSDRAQDNWEALLAIAACAGEAWLTRATEAALKLSRASDAKVSTGNELLADIRQVFEGRTGTKISTVDLIAELVSDEERSWGTYNRGKPMTPRQLAKQLDAYGIKSKTVRLGPANTPKGYEFSQFDDAFARYLADAPPAPPTGQRDAAGVVAETPQRAPDLDSASQVRGGVADTSQGTAGDPTADDRY